MSTQPAPARSSSPSRPAHALTDEELVQLAEHELWLRSKGAKGSCANFEAHDFSNRDLEGRDLQGSNMSAANLAHANLRRANLTGAVLRGANVRNADLCEAVLRDADLTQVTGLLPAQLAATDLHGATLPEGFTEFAGLKWVEDASEYCRKLLIGLLAACAYCWLTIAATTDVSLVTNKASSPLPFVGAPFPIAGFYLAAPLILFAVYLYFHLNLLRLWGQLADLPAILPDGRALDQAADPWLMVGLVRSHLERLRTKRPPLSHLQSVLALLMGWFAVPLTVAWFWFRYLTRQDWGGTLLQILLLAASTFLGYYFAVITRRILRGRGGSYPRNRMLLVLGASVSVVVTVLAFFFTSAGILGVTETSPTAVRALARLMRIQTPLPAAKVAYIGHQFHENYPEEVPNLDGWYGVQLWLPRIAKYFGYAPYAELRQADLSIKPTTWHNSSADEQLLSEVTGAKLNGRSLRFAGGYGAFLVNAQLVGANLAGADLGSADIRNANLVTADLTGADLADATLVGAHLHGANLTHASLKFANLREADFEFANLQGVDLQGAKLKGAKLMLAHLEGACLWDVDDLDPKDLMSAKGWRDAILPEELLGKDGIDVHQNINVLKAHSAEHGDELLGCWGQAEANPPPGSFTPPQ